MSVPFAMAVRRDAPEHGRYGIRVQLVSVYRKAHSRLIDHATHISDDAGLLVSWNFVSHKLLWIVLQFTAPIQMDSAALAVTVLTRRLHSEPGSAGVRSDHDGPDLVAFNHERSAGIFKDIVTNLADPIGLAVLQSTLFQSVVFLPLP
jgi:hypothetical protein